MIGSCLSFTCPKRIKPPSVALLGIALYQIPHSINPSRLLVALYPLLHSIYYSCYLHFYNAYSSSLVHSPVRFPWLWGPRSVISKILYPLRDLNLLSAADQNDWIDPAYVVNRCTSGPNPTTRDAENYIKRGAQYRLFCERIPWILGLAFNTFILSRH